MSEKVCKEVAQEDFSRFAELMDVDLEHDGASEEDIKSFNVQKSCIVRGIQRGAVSIDEHGELTLTPLKSENNKPITFKEATAEVFAIMDKKKDNEATGKIILALSQLSGQPPSRFRSLAISDFKICMAVGVFFLAQ